MIDVGVAATDKQVVTGPARQMGTVTVERAATQLVVAGAAIEAVAGGVATDKQVVTVVAVEKVVGAIAGAQYIVTGLAVKDVPVLIGKGTMMSWPSPRSK